ncbi:MAG: hypothetical protein M0Z52_12595 [Actinomycetota bacterium]|nr:hypothetical protein [Actinomycetota bacterium]
MKARLFVLFHPLCRNMVIACCLLLASGCACRMLGSRVMTLPRTLPGYYTAILYGGKPGEQRNTAIILAAENSGYSFEISSLSHSHYTTMQHVRGDEVAALASNIVPYFIKSTSIQFKRIMDESGQKVIGYEITPFGFTLVPAEPPSITYELCKKGVVKVMIWPSPDVERRQES